MLHSQHVWGDLTEISWHTAGKHRGRDGSVSSSRDGSSKERAAPGNPQSPAEWQGVFMHTHSSHWDRQGDVDPFPLQGMKILPFWKAWVHCHVTVMVVSLCGLNIGFLNYPIHLICEVEDFMKADIMAMLVRQ